VVPGTTEPLRSAEEARAPAERVGYPVMLKAAGGGGGKGMRKVERAEELESAWRAARSEALSSFGSEAVYLEKFLEAPRHIEIQVFADSHGNCVHLNERECSAQRRHQKVIEETPSPIVDGSLREAMGAVAVKAAKEVGYIGAGTIEFLLDAHRKFYFLEMNTRLQVEHPVTEWVTGLDLVAWQIQVAQGERLPKQRTFSPRGHAIEARVYAEDPNQNFLPSPGRIESLRFPAGPHVRNDSGVYEGYTVPREYDPMISKVSAWGLTREEAIARLRRALSEFVVTGIRTNIRYLATVLRHPAFVAGNYDTAFLGREHARLLRGDQKNGEAAQLAAVIFAHRRDAERSGSLTHRDGWGTQSPWRQLSRSSRLRRPGRP
jgi:acetyl-CoA carboxylase, biotin carboxylase subunit